MPKKVEVPKKSGIACNARLSEIGKLIDAQMHYIKKMNEPNKFLLTTQFELIEKYDPKCKPSFIKTVEKTIDKVLTEIKTKCVPLETPEEIIKCTEDIQKKNPIIFYEDIQNALANAMKKEEQDNLFFELVKMKYEGMGEEEERVPQEAIERNIWQAMFS